MVPRKINRLSKISKVKCQLELSGDKDKGDGWKERRREKQRPREGRQDLGLPQALGFPRYNAVRCILPLLQKLCSFLHVKPARLESQMQLPLWTPAVGTTVLVPGT